LHSGAVQEVDN